MSNSQFENDVILYNAVLDTVKILATALPYDAETLNNMICDNGLHRELLTEADPRSDDYSDDDFAAASDEFDGYLYEAIEAGVKWRESNQSGPLPKDTRVIQLRDRQHC